MNYKVSFSKVVGKTINNIGYYFALFFLKVFVG